jgi:tetratricopeptide (TPR) repeat protein
MQMSLFAHKLPGIPTVYVISALALAVATTTSNQLSYAGNNKFFCAQEGDIPVTKVRTSRGNETFIRWVVEDFKQFPPLRRCQIVSARFQRYYDNGLLLITSRDNFNNFPVLCIANRKGVPCKSEDLLVTLKRGTDTGRVLQQIIDFRIEGKPVNLSGCQAITYEQGDLYLDVKQLIDDNKCSQSSSRKNIKKGDKMKIFSGVLTVFLGAKIVMVQPQVAAALTESGAFQVTVRIDGANTGSGVIIDRQENSYTVLTNWHVVEPAGNYTIQTYDRNTYQVNKSRIKRLGNLDLAEVQFTSTQNYRKADLYFDRLNVRIPVYVSGWADPDSVGIIPEYLLIPQVITRIAEKPKNEYSLVFNTPTKSGMSGGPILNEQGRLVGIHGQSRVDPRTEGIDFLGIPIQIYLRYGSPTAKRLQTQANLIEPKPVKPPSSTRPLPPREIATRNIPKTPQPENPKPSDGQDYLARGNQMLRRDEQGALENFKRFQQLNPNEAQKEGLKIATQVAATLKYVPEYSSTYLSQVRAATVLAPNRDDVWYLLGRIYVQTKQYDDAILALKKAKTLNLKNADVLFTLAQVYYQQQNYPAAIQSLQAGLKLRPNEAEQLLLLGFIFHKQGKLADAITQYLQASAQSTKYSSVSTAALNNIGLINYEQGNVTAAIRQWTAVLETNRFQPPVETQLALSVALYTKGERQQAQKLAQQALRHDPRYQNIEFLKQNLWGDRLLADTTKFLQYLEKQ